MLNTPDLDEVQRVSRLLLEHTWNPRTGCCTCKWEPAHDRGALRLHAEHVARVVLTT